MRSLRVSVALLIAASAWADATTLRNDRFHDPFWDLSYSAPGLTKLLVETPEDFVFAGRCDPGLEIHIRVIESTEPADAARARDQARSEWKQAGRKPEAVETSDAPVPSILFVEKHLAVYDRHVGYAWHARGYHCFEIRVTAFERTDRTGDAIRAALKGLKVGPRDEGAILARRVAWDAGRETSDPHALLEAGSDYVTGRRFRRIHNVLARRLLARARRLMKPDDPFEPGDLWRLYQMGGSAWIREPQRDLGQAMEWFGRAEQAAAKLTESRAERAAQSAYNLGCAAALAGKVDEAFAALHRAYAEVKPVTDDAISADKDLDILRRDPRWETFWRTKVKS